MTDWLKTDRALADSDLEPLRKKEARYALSLGRGAVRYVLVDSAILALALTVASGLVEQRIELQRFIICLFILLVWRGLSWQHMKAMQPVLREEIATKKENTNPPKRYNHLRIGFALFCVLGPFVFAYAHGVYKRAHPEKYPRSAPIYYIK